MSLSVVLVEDSAEDAELVESWLAAEDLSCSITRVDTLSDFLLALDQQDLDLILADYTLPSFDGVTALRLAQEKRPEIPFIYVSGTLGEELAIESLKSGATDYVLKHRLSRLPAAVRRAIAEVEQRAMLKEMESRLREAEKMEIVGRLAAGIAHDFNNLLTVINGYVGLALAGLAPGSKTYREVQAIGAAGDRAATLARRLLTFSGQQVHEPRVLDINAMVGSLEHLLKHLIHNEIQLRVELDPRAGRVSVDPIQIEQVLMNLVANARDAMPEGGELRVTTGIAHLDERAERLGVAPGSYVVLTVSDTGCGMDEGTQARIFEPFFTTKAVGKGTGLGLWSSREIVRRHHGAIVAHSEAGRGTSLRVYLPRTPDEAGGVKPSNEVSPVQGVTALPAANDTREDSGQPILLVDDDPLVRAFLRDVLTPFGYRVREAANGRQALGQLRSEPVALMVTDLIMPESEGLETIQAVKKEFPRLPIVAMSGGFGRQFLPVARHLGAEETLQKPISADVFLTTVQRLLC